MSLDMAHYKQLLQREGYQNLMKECDAPPPSLRRSVWWPDNGAERGLCAQAAALRGVALITKYA